MGRLVVAHPVYHLSLHTMFTIAVAVTLGVGRWVPTTRGRRISNHGMAFDSALGMILGQGPASLVWCSLFMCDICCIA